MTHDTPGEDDADRLWCAHCELSVEPEGGGGKPECPACGREL